MKPTQHALDEADHEDLKHFETLQLDSKFVINSYLACPVLSMLLGKTLKCSSIAAT